MKKTEIHKADVLKLFYRTELRPGEDVIDNQDKTIAKELNINVSIVWRITQHETKQSIIKLKQL